MRSHLRKFYKKTQEYVWKVGIVQNTLDGILAGEPLNVKWVGGETPGTWWADPFILDANEHYLVLLVEEYHMTNRRGVIAQLTIDRRSMQVTRRTEVLRLDTHLSFPAIHRSADGQVFIYPESCNKGCLEVYRYDADTQRLTEPQKVCNEPLTDAIFSTLLGFPALFSTQRPAPNSMHLNVYRSAQADDGHPWHECSFSLAGSYVFPRRTARCAGQWFVHEGRLYRPAMECEVEYGHAVELQEMVVTPATDASQPAATPDVAGLPHVSFKPVRTLLSPDRQYDRGLHTFNVFGDVIVVDVKGYRYPILGRLMRKIRKFHSCGCSAKRRKPNTQ